MIEKELKNKNDCMGCHACATICPEDCISMKFDQEGFLYPNVDDDLCIKCNQCVKVCPIINKIKVDNNPVAYSCVNTDEKIRLNSSSGGIFTLAAERIIDRKGVVFGASFDDNFQVKHTFIERKDKLWHLRGSKYVQSEIGNTYKEAKEFLDSGREVLFTGTPCQIGGLKSYLGRIYEKLLTIDIICHGVPSPKVWQKYIEYRETEANSEIQRISFRRKDEGWKRYSVSFSYKNDTEYRKIFSKDLYMTAFLKDICLRPSCHECEFKTLNRNSDITLADFWGIQNILPEMDDDKGTSLIFINTKTGHNLFEEIKNRMLFEEVNINEAIKYNSAAIKSSLPSTNRKEFFKNSDRFSFDILVKKYCRDKLSIRVGRKIRLTIKKIAIKLRLFRMIKSIMR